MFAPIAVERYRWHPTGVEAARIESKKFTRLDVMKTTFDSLVNKVEALDLPVALGLVTFGTSVERRAALRMTRSGSRQSLGSIEASGDTALYDGLSLAASLLENFRKEARRHIC